MRIGRLPGMEEALREEMQRRERRTSRRMLLKGIVATAGAGAIGVWIGATWLAPTARPRPRIPEDLAEARRLARAPLDELVDRYVEVLDAIDLHGGDPELWLGVRRLARWALAEPGRADRERVAQQIELTLAARRGLPQDVAELLAGVRRRPRGGEGK